MREVFVCIDAHTCGNPVRLVVEGGPELVGNNMMEKRLDFIEKFDYVRKGLMFEPRGHDMMSGSILYPASDPDNDIGILYIETSGCLPMCGHGTIGTVTIMIEEGLIKPKVEGKLKIETPAGLIEVTYKEDNGKVRSVKLVNIPSFLHSTNLEVECPDLGMLTVDVAYGGNFYAIVDSQENFNGIQDYTASQIIAWSRALRDKLNASFTFEHPNDRNIKGLSHLLWVGDVIDPKSDGRNAVFYGDKAIDRSPCGTGTSARLAQLYCKGDLLVGDTYIHESFIGSTFIGKIEKETTCGLHKAIIPSIEGWAKITGYNTIIIDDEDDPYAHGFQVL
jgi:4-hydroxyproline epimerase